MDKPIHIFNRHCGFSDASAHKNRPSWFNRKICHKNLLRNIDADLADIHIFYDAAKMGIDEHFISKSNYPYRSTYVTRKGTEAAAFIELLYYIDSLKLPDETILYIVEDDYLHKARFCEVLVDGFKYVNTDTSMLTLTDYADKYFAQEYKELKSSIHVSKLCHWRSTPSTTNTFATTAKLLKDTFDTHTKYSTSVSVSLDHKRFCELASNGITLYSSIPGFSSHIESGYLSPCIDWERE